MANYYGGDFTFADVSAGESHYELVPAQTGKIIRVLAAWLLAQGTSTLVNFNSSSITTDTPISAGITCADTGGGAVLPTCAEGWFWTASGESLTVTTGSGSTVGIQIRYVVVNP